MTYDPVPVTLDAAQPDPSQIHGPPTRLTPAEQRAHVLKFAAVAGRIAVNLYRKNRHCEFRDILGESRLALCKAASKFDPTRGWKFITYAYSVCYREAVKFCIRQHARGLHVPESHDAYIAPAMAEANPDIDAARPDPREGLPEFPKGFWRRVTSRLTEREKQAVLLVFKAGKRRADVARELGISKERVRQLLESALGKLKKRKGVRRMMEEAA